MSAFWTVLKSLKLLEPIRAPTPLGCQREVARVRGIAAEGTSADCQLSTFAKARAQGLPERKALGAVVDWLAQATAGQQAS